MAMKGAKNPKQAEAKASVGPRVRKPTKKQAKTQARQASVPTGFQLVVKSAHIYKRHWKILSGLLIVYLILNILFASGISSINSTVNSIKADLNNTSLTAHPLVSAATGFALLITSAGSSGNTVGGILQAVLIIIQSLVIIWALRHLLAGRPVRLKQAYYNATAPLIPFLLVIGVIFIQLLPVTIGSAILAAIVSAVGNISGIWSITFGVSLFCLAAWSLYMLSSSIFSLYIVTLPQVTPLGALRSAKNLVRYRRWLVLRRVFFLPLFIVISLGVIIIPLIMYATFLVTPVFYILIAITLLFVHSYLYNLYRGLLG